ncbi:hypothetical protein BC628DRAFT_1350487 [Trametes gibbosa]|nr:hypothetical protein BC628DRAFT_1350487 [Trametes gibbosa]
MAPYLCLICQDLHRIEHLRSLPCGESFALRTLRGGLYGHVYRAGPSKGHMRGPSAAGPISAHRMLTPRPRPRASSTGHTFCSECIKRCIDVARNVDANGRRRVADREVKCPSCRRPFKGGEEHPIYLDVGETTTTTATAAEAAAEAGGSKPCHGNAVHARIDAATREVDRVAHDLRPQTVRKAALEVAKVVELGGGARECCHLGLLAAVAARWRSMLPLFAELSARRDEALGLRAELERARDERNAAVAERVQAEDIASEAVETTAKAQRAAQDSADNSAALKKEVERLKKVHKEELAAQRERVNMLTTNLGRHKAKEAKQKMELDKLRAENESLAASQLISPEAEDGDGASRTLVSVNAQMYDMSGSQATFERLPSTSRKRRGSEDDLVVLETQRYSDSDDDPPIQHTPPVRPRKPLSKVSLAPKSCVFRTDWQIPQEQVRQKGTVRMPQRPLSTASATFPLTLDHKGKPLRPVQTGSRKRMRVDS